MNTELEVRRHQQTDLATGEIRQRFVALDKYDDEGDSAPQGPPTLAKISAGYKGENGYPQVSRDGTIYLTDPDGRAPGLRAALDAADKARRDEDGKVVSSMRLNIALPFDAIEDNLHQAYFRYSSGRLEARGDRFSITELLVTKWRPTKGGQEPAEIERHTYYRDDSPKTVEFSDGGTTQVPVEHGAFKQLRRSCQVVWSLLFTLGEWVGTGEDAFAQPILTDGLGVYRVGSSSRKGLIEIGEYLELVSTLCHGRLRGIVLELMLTYPTVFDPLGSRRNQVPRWTLVFKPPAGIALNPTRWQELASGSLREGAKLALPSASPVDTWEDVERDVRDLVELPDEQMLDQLLSGDLPAGRQEAYWRDQWFGKVRDSSLAGERGRASFIRTYTQGRTDSLAALIARSTNGQMERFIGAAETQAARERIAAAQPVEVIAPARDADTVRDTREGEVDELRRKAAEYDRLMASQDTFEASSRPGWGRASGSEPFQPGEPGYEDEIQVHSPDPEPPSGLGFAGPTIEATGTVVQPNVIQAQCLFCDSIQDCKQVGEDGFACIDGDACKARVAASIDSPDAAATASAPPEVPPASGGPISEDLPEVLARELRPDTGGGEFFNCAACGAQVVTVNVQGQGALDARAWLARLAREGIGRPLCVKDARAELRTRDKAPR